ncbi:adenylosuccinate lyase [Candidatus Solincola tengchongensis]|uniref:adenylosuccinate lyase n=1 Tax=Candidatus Solincola tengchongensis TaxID=2900693 RepID=UPI0025798E14|nr:adenylosuccinate lyase [Candidatus Solincola tengchongensis]
MIERYTLPEMASVWSEENKLRKWLEIEILAVEARVERGEVPREALEEIKARAAFDVRRVKEIEESVHHDVIAFLTNVAENVGEASRFIHYGMTSSDILDTGLALQMREAMDLILEEAVALTSTLKTKALECRDVVMVGRTHGVHAEPMVFGQKLALWAFEMARNVQRLRRAREVIGYGKVSGAVGTYAHLDPWVEEYVCERLGLRPAEVSTQVLQRDRHAEYLTALAMTGASLEKFALEVRGLQRTEVREAEEPFRRGQKGSSAMPHKRNPILCERICGLARVLRSNAMAAMENIALWHERDISHSSVERVIIPDSTTLLHYMLVKFHGVVRDLTLYPENMLRNLELTRGLVFSESVLLALVRKGLTREEAYGLVQRNAMQCWSTGKDFQSLLLEDPEVTRHLDREELKACFDLPSHLRNMGRIFERLEDLVI